MKPAPITHLPPTPRRPEPPGPAPSRPSAARPSAAVLALLALVGSLLLAGCGNPPGTGSREEIGAAAGEEEATGTRSETVRSETVRSYTVQGVVRQLPDPGDASKQLLIHHAPIPDYVNSEGYETGMPSMTMPFFPAAGVELGEIAAGDWVEFTLAVDWQATPAIQVTAIRRIEPPTPAQ